MSLIVSVYDDNDKGIENRICFWLRLDAWHLCEAAMVFVDIDPDTSNWQNKEEESFNRFVTFRRCYYSIFADKDSFEIGGKEIREIIKKYGDMYRILFNPDIEYDTPNNWIERAIAKKVNIPWLEFAIRKGFYVPKNEPATKQETEKPLHVRTENNYLRLIMALANGIKDFNPTKPYEAAKLIIDETGIENISQQTIKDYISKAHALDSKEKG